MDGAERDVIETVDEILGCAIETGMQCVGDVRREQRDDQKPHDEDAPDEREQLAIRVDASHERQLAGRCRPIISGVKR